MVDGELAACCSLNQVIDGPICIFPNSVSCIDLIFTTDTNFVTDLGVLPLLFLRCHHQLIFVKVSSTTFFLQRTGRESEISQGLTSMLSGKLLITLVGIGHSTA